MRQKHPISRITVLNLMKNSFGVSPKVLLTECERSSFSYCSDKMAARTVAWSSSLGTETCLRGATRDLAGNNDTETSVSVTILT